MPDAIQANLVKVVKPAFVSLVGLPANQAPLKVIRSAAHQGETPMNKPMRRTARRSDSPNAVLKITFPETMSDDEVNSALKTYGMRDFAIDRTDGVVTATRSDLQSIAKPDSPTMDIKLSEGITATILRSVSVAPTDAKQNISVVGFEFPAETFGTDEIGAWLSKNSVDNASEPVENSDSSFVVTRGEVEEGAETRLLKLEDGVVLTITRSCECDVPEGMAVAVCEAAYGSWGWGQLDFAAALADVEFCEWMDKGLSRLRDVLWNILFYSQLPLAARKELVANSLAQYGAFVSSVMDQLPRQMMVSVVRSAQLQEISMSEKNTPAGGTPTTAAPTTTATPPATPVAQVGDSVTVSRAELASMIAAGVADGLANVEKAKLEEAQRAAAAEAAKPITRSDLAAVVAEAVKPMQEEITALKGATVLRSDTPDPKIEQVADKGNVKNVFRGVFGDLPGQRVSKTAA